MFDSIKDFWADIVEMREARMVLWITVLAITFCVAIYIIKWFRDLTIGDQSMGSDPITSFRELREQGKLDEDEYRRLKASIRGKQVNSDEIVFNEESSPLKPESGEKSNST